MPRLRRWAGRLKAELRTLYLACGDPRVPRHVRVLIIVVVAYAFSPVDLIPDPVPVLGYLDDLILTPLGIALAVRPIPKKVLAECRVKVQNTDAKTGPEGPAAAVVVTVVWVPFAAFAVYLAARFV